MSREIIERLSGYHKTEPEECRYVASGGHAACDCDVLAEIERLLAAERAQTEVDTKTYWGIELECSHVRMNLVNYPETDLTVCRACVSEKKAIVEEREKVREMCAKAMCFHCAEGNTPLNSMGAWGHHLEKKVNDTTMRSWYENCEASPIRQLDLTAPSSTEEGE